MNKLEKNKVCSISQGRTFASNLAIAQERGLEVASLREYARSLEEYPTNECMSLPVGFVREGVLFVPQKAVLMIRDSPLIEISNAEMLTRQVLENKEKYRAIRAKACQEGRGRELSSIHMEESHYPFYLDADRYLEKAREEEDLPIEERSVLALKPEYISSEGYLEIPFKKLEDAEVFRWAFRDYAGPQADYLRSVCFKDKEFLIGNFGIKFRDEFEKPSIRQLWYSPSESGEFGITGNQKYYYGAVLAVKRGEK